MNKLIVLFGALAVCFVSWSFTAFRQIDRMGSASAAAETPDCKDDFYLRKVENASFRAGEVTKYKVSYGWFTAATAEFQVGPQLSSYGGRDCYRLHGYVKTAGAGGMFYDLNNEFHSYMDKDAMIPWYYTRASREDDYRYFDTVRFFHDQQKIVGKKGTFNNVPRYTQDVMSAFYYARCLDIRNMPNGTVVDIPCFLDDEVYDLGLTVVKREVIKTKFGKMRTIKILPRMVEGRVFKADDQMEIWVTDDDNLLPVKVKSPILIGSITVELESYKNLRNPINAKI